MGLFDFLRPNRLTDPDEKNMAIEVARYLCQRQQGLWNADPFGEHAKSCLKNGGICSDHEYQGKQIIGALKNYVKDREE